MKKPILLLSFILFAWTCSAQRAKLRSYYYWINQAELAICDSNYQKASDCYDKAFQYKAPFGRDAFFAFKLNHKYSYNISRASQCFHYLAQMGDKPDWYIEVQDTIQYRELWNKIKIIADTTKVTVNPDIAIIFDQIISSDQSIRKHPELYDSDESWLTAIRETDSTNFETLKNLYNTYPVINEYTAGQSLHLKTLFFHFRREYFCDPKSILYKEVLKGNINASEYADIEDKCMDIIRDKEEHLVSMYGRTTQYVFCIDTIGFIIQPENTRQINKKRKKILLSETWDDYVKKVKYVYCYDNDFNFVPLAKPYYPPEDAANIIRNTISDIDNGIIKGSYFVLPKSKRL